MECNVLPVRVEKTLLTDWKLLVDSLDHGTKLIHVDNIGLPAVQLNKILSLYLSPAGLHYVERAAYDR